MGGCKSGENEEMLSQMVCVEKNIKGHSKS